MKKILIFLLLFFTVVVNAQNELARKDTVKKYISDSVHVINTRIDSVIANLGAGGADTLAQDIIILNYAQYSTPEEYGAVGDGIANDQVAVKKAIDSSGTRKVSFKGIYKIEDSVVVDLASGERDIIFAEGSSIISSAVSPGGSYYSPVADVTFRNGTKLTIRGGSIDGNGASSNTYQNAFLIQNIREVEVENATIRGGKYASFRADNVDILTFKNATIDSGHYANKLISGTLQTNIYGGRTADAGYDLTNSDQGYNISFMGRYGGRDNQNVTIEGHVSEHANRNCIDLHGSINSKISTTTVRGFGHTGISGVNENGNLGYEKHNRNRIISNCIIVQDSFWLVNKIAGLDTTTWWSGIEFGDYSVGSNPLTNGSGAWNVNNVIFDSMDAPGSRANIFVWNNGVKDTTPQMESVTLNNLTFINTNVTTQKFGTLSDSTQDAVIFFTESNYPPKQININNINIYGTGTNGVKILSYTVNDTPSTNVAVNGVHVNGTFTYPLYVHPSLRQITSANTYNGKRLADLDDGYGGQQNFSLYTSGSADTTLLFTVNANYAVDGNVKYNIDISMEEDLTHAGCDYRYVATAGNDDGITDSSITLISEFALSGDASSYRPTLYWSGTGDVKSLYLICPTQYAKYNITTKINSRTLAFWRTE